MIKLKYFIFYPEKKIDVLIFQYIHTYMLGKLKNLKI